LYNKSNLLSNAIVQATSVNVSTYAEIPI